MCSGGDDELVEEDAGGEESWSHDEESREGEAVEDAALVDAGPVEVRNVGSDGGLEIAEGVVRGLGWGLREDAGRRMAAQGDAIHGLFPF